MSSSRGRRRQAADHATEPSRAGITRWVAGAAAPIVKDTTSGMHPLTPYLEGLLPHPQGRRLAGLQRCLRTTDLDEVGDDRHLTVFQMLGSWSLGDYDGPQSLRWGCQLAVDGLGIGRDRLHATAFGGDEQVGPDLESMRTWAELGVPVELTTDDNWWSNGPTGPCGPDSEMFAWTGDGPPQGSPGTDERWMELWNHVTMCYRRHADGRLEPLPQRSVDTGMGLERLLMVTQGMPSVFDCDVFRPWMSTLPRLWRPDERSLRLLADHLRASIVIIGEVLRTEERRFAGLLTRGRKVLAQLSPGRPLTEAHLRYLHQTHGLPPELVTDLLA